MYPLTLGISDSQYYQSFDPDATTYINAVLSAGGSLTDLEKNAIDQLYVDLKGYGVYTKLLMMYPFLGGSFSAYSINGIGSSYTLSYYNTPGLTVNSDGLQFGNGYANPGLYADDSNIDINDVHVGVYVTVPCTGCGNEVEFGGTTATSGYQGGFIFPLGNVPVYKVIYDNGLGGNSWGDNNARYGILNKIDSSTVNQWENGSKVQTYTGKSTTAAENQLQMIGCWYIDGGTPYYLSTKTIGFFHLGTSLDDTDAANISSAVNTFMTTISRNIY